LTDNIVSLYLDISKVPLVIWTIQRLLSAETPGEEEKCFQGMSRERGDPRHMNIDIKSHHSNKPK